MASADTAGQSRSATMGPMASGSSWPTTMPQRWSLRSGWRPRTCGTSNPEGPGAACAPAALEADVVAGQELTSAFAAAIDASAVSADHPHQVLDAREGTRGSGIYSRHRIDHGGVVRLAGVPQTWARVRTPSGPVVVMSVHTTQPVGNSDPLRAELADLRRWTDRVDDAPVVAGDLDTGPMHEAFRSFLGDSGLDDAHQEVGRGLATTWPAGRRVPPFAGLDHMLIDPEVAVASVREFAVPGSDHLGVVADLSAG